MSWYSLIYLALTGDDEEEYLTNDAGTVILTSDAPTGGPVTSTWTAESGVT